MSGLVVHEWIESFGGAEKVVSEMLSEFPSAELFALWSDVGPRFRGTQIQESALARSALRRRKALALMAMPAVWRHVRVADDPDWILVSSHAFAHQVRVNGRDLPKFVYAHTPARYLWDADIDPRGKRLAARAVAPALRLLDRKRAKEAAEVAANSEFVQARIRRAWDRDARVIYPPVDVDRIASVHTWVDALDTHDECLVRSLPPSYILGASRLVPYKRLDLVIQVASELDIPAVIAGSGPDLARLRSLAQDCRAPVHFVESPSDPLLMALYQGALAFVFPATEDFGIMPVEALAAGCPTVVSGVGGQSESARLSSLGVIAEDDSISSIASAVSFAADLDSVPVGTRMAELSRFTPEAFRRGLRSMIDEGIR